MWKLETRNLKLGNDELYMRKKTKIFLLILAICTLVVLAAFGWWRWQVGLERAFDLKDALNRQVPVGTNSDAVRNFLDDERFKHSDLTEDKKIFAKKIVPGSWWIERSILLEFYFDEDGKLASSTVREGLTGL